MRADLDRVQQMIGRDPGAAMRELDEAARARDWRGLTIERGGASNISERTVNDIWGEIRAAQAGGDTRTAQQLAYLYGVIETPEFCCRLRWEVGTLAVWDNRCTSHYAVADYWPRRRRMQRASVCGEVPV